jgi:tetratricopeptide (TPR) repeat protein
MKGFMAATVAAALTALVLPGLCLAETDAEKEFNKGAVLSSSGHYEDAANAFGRATGYDPKFAEAYLARGKALFALHNYNGAVEEYRKALLLDQYLDAYSQMGYCLICLGKYNEALTILDTGEKLLGPDRSTRLNTALALDRRGFDQDSDRIVKIEEELVAQNPDDVVAMAVYAMQNRKDLLVNKLQTLTEKQREYLKRTISLSAGRQDDDLKMMIR